MKNIKMIAVLVLAAGLSAAAVSYLLSEETPTRPQPATKTNVKATNDHQTKVRERKRGEKISVADMTAKKPSFDLGDLAEDKLLDTQRALIEEIRKALEEDNYRELMRLVHQLQQSDEWPDGIPDQVKKAALDALGWYGGKCLPEIVAFLADGNPAIVQQAVEDWEDAIAELESDREIAAQVKLAARVVTDADSIESILTEILNMRHSVAVDTIKDVLANGTDIAKQKVLDQISDLTSSETIRTAEELDKWLKDNPDDPDDEEMYGGMPSVDED